jgi:hypothetical protein
VTDLIEFLNARLAEDEATAKRVQPNQSPTELRAMVGREGGEPFLIVASERVLREVSAKRAILEDHRIVKADVDTEDFDFGCERCYFNRDEGVAGYGYCPTLKALAAVYSDHPDYDESWKP